MNSLAKKYDNVVDRKSAKDLIHRPVIYDHDLSYKRLLGLTQWQRLKPEIRRRFSIRPSANRQITYKGIMTIVYLSFMGKLFAECCRLIGRPLTTKAGNDVPVEVKLIEDNKHHGIAWQRHYFFNDASQIITSTKSINNDGELEEHIGCGFSMRLHVFQKESDLYFQSEKYLFRLGEYTFQIPALLTPGKTTVIHKQLKGNKFRFSLLVEHPVLGITIKQVGDFYLVNEREDLRK